jgi:hypothetical protein
VWNADDYEFRALIKKENKLVRELPLQFSGQPSVFSVSFRPEETGEYELIVYAYNPDSGNTGVDRVSFSVK